ncbi:pyridoxal phosphate-dependent aminotransferase [Pseudohoeflea coraliihabitans]|uniref:Aminotransferase class I/II-fold pyridoxal phosphate-dependent enzyme n=1 Tax=Pseudohoeflea coraliihabitans TaxID=2860393 RepID=A0ABS6WSL7_9HYPH|nr:aminotransferase class I/II-fold pyridoxal phosphate-dependent enzyme [Pseudohoeflea sp. DP4N28-3]MBW3098941.1 aminotransferase class I/II-fold pyridoxal phosphate-dependent enzyme [Pseudohoeflea sp. DP4N28-3]
MITPKRPTLAPFHAMDVLAEATRLKGAGKDVISLAVGQPAHPAPQTALAAARAALEDGRIGYTDALGSAAFRTAVAEFYRQRHHIEVDPGRIAATNGSSAGFNLVFLQFFRPGETVAISRPGYPAYRNILQALGLKVAEIHVGAETGYVLTPEAIEEHERQHQIRVDGVMVASPANPTGTVTSRAQLQKLADWCAERDAVFISDEIYHGLTFSGEETTALAISDRAIVINSFSKYFCMTGWRIGWMVLPQDLVRPIECLAQSLYICPSELSQIAATAAFDGIAEMEAVKAGYARNRDLFAQRLPELGLPLASPMDGAFYALCDVSRHTNDSMAFAREMLQSIHVAATPGLDFDLIDGHRLLRFSYAGDHNDMQQALDRMQAWLPTRRV